MGAVTSMFLMNEKPAYAGVYKLNRLDGSPNIYSLWLDGCWHTACDTVDKAAGQYGWEYFNDEPHIYIGWRGLAEFTDAKWTKVKYVLAPGEVQSDSDRQWHFVNADSLAKLYKVSLDECYVRTPFSTLKFSYIVQRYLDSLPYLCPREDGNYTIPKGRYEK